jgi:hypothetical protein
VLSLDISGAFDTVNYVQLLDNLQTKQVPLWFIQMIRSFLSEQTTTLIVNNEETSPRELRAGVPQRSLLSPILFIFYNSNLLELLNQPDSCLSLLGFADNVNLLTYRTSTTENCMSLELEHDKCLA